MLEDNFREVKQRIEEACRRSGRDPKEVTLIAVSKTKPVEMLQEAYDFGTRIFGENKVQELTDKYEQMPKDIHWHLIGHLQRNKVKYIIDKVDLIHSVDSLRLAETIDKEAQKHGLIANSSLFIEHPKIWFALKTRQKRYSEDLEDLRKYLHL